MGEKNWERKTGVVENKFIKMLKKILTFLILILTIFTNSWSFVFANGEYTIYRNNDNILVEKISELEYKVYGKKEGTSILKVEDSYGKSRSIEVKVGEESEIEKIIKELFKSYGQIVVFKNDGIQITSAKKSEICEKQRTGDFFAKPQYGYCVDNSFLKEAWKCEVGYTDLYSYGKINSCIKNEYLEEYKKKQGSFEKLNLLFSKMSKLKLEELIESKKHIVLNL